MSAVTGEIECPHCGERVLMVRVASAGTTVLLDTKRTDGGWEPKSEAGMLVATYNAPGEKRERNGHHAHGLQCAKNRSLIAESQHRIDDRCTEPVELPVLTDEGVRALVRGDLVLA